MTGLDPSVGKAWVAGYINGSSYLQAHGTFGGSTGEFGTLDKSFFRPSGPPAAPATNATYAAKNVQIGQWNPAASWAEVVVGDFAGDGTTGIYTQQAGSPKKFGILGRSVGSTPNTWEKAISSGTAFTSSAAPGYPA